MLSIKIPVYTRPNQFLFKEGSFSITSLQAFIFSTYEFYKIAV